MNALTILNWKRTHCKSEQKNKRNRISNNRNQCLTCFHNCYLLHVFGMFCFQCIFQLCFQNEKANDKKVFSILCTTCKTWRILSNIRNIVTKWHWTSFSPCCYFSMRSVTFWTFSFSTLSYGLLFTTLILCAMWHISMMTQFSFVYLACYFALSSNLRFFNFRAQQQKSMFFSCIFV